MMKSKICTLVGNLAERVKQSELAVRCYETADTAKSHLRAAEVALDAGLYDYVERNYKKSKAMYKVMIADLFDDYITSIEDNLYK